MEIFLLLIVIAILISIRSSVANKNKHLLNEISKLKTELILIQTKLSNFQFGSSENKAAETSKADVKKSEEEQEVKPSAANEKTIILMDSFTPPKPIGFENERPNVNSNKYEFDAIKKDSPIENEPVIMPLYDSIKDTNKTWTSKNDEPKKSFMERNPDLEKFIGENLVNKIGIAILVLGIGYFVKFAIDKNWINEIGRVAIGILSGGVLIGLAHRLRKDFAAFSSVLVGGGISILYFTISLAFHDYHLFSQSLAFAMMIVITAFAVVLSIAYDKIELAVLAIIGGFGSPFFVSTGQGNHIILFSYLLILNGGMLSLAYYKKWNLVNIICYAFTVLIFGGWLLSKFDSTLHNPIVVVIFALAFYMVFFAMNIVYNLKNKLPFKAIELSLLLSNTFLFFSAGLYLLNSPQLIDFKGLFTIVIGMFNLGFAYPLYKRGDTDKNLIFMLIGLVLTFISLAAPIQLNGHYITLFWAAEMVLLLWLSQKSGIRLIKLTSLLLLVLLLLSLFIDWSKIYSNTAAFLLPFANKAFVTSLFAVAAIVIKLRLLKNESNELFKASPITLKEYKLILQCIIIVVLYLSLLLEIVHQTQYYLKNETIRNILMLCYHFSYVTILIQLNKNQTHSIYNVIKIALLGVSLLVFFICNTNIIEVRNEILQFHAPKKLFFFLHFYLVITSFYFIKNLHETIKIELFNDASKIKFLFWLSAVLLIITASMELDHLIVYSMFNEHLSINYLLNQNHKFGYAILWGAFAFVLINIGMRRKIREIRIISLALFTLVILKLFIYDINNISEAGRIIAFVLLGVLLLVVSFMYQRLKKLLTSDNDVNEQKHETD
ncbi:MAG TPA: DUF2339 domain-containing protein [Bacteroidia bacterium]|nr:DUF2339 domain-containing protein [Bacteroidia bacterium]